MEKFIAKIGDIIQFPTMAEREIRSQVLFPRNKKVRFEATAYLTNVLRNGQRDWLLLAVKVKDTEGKHPIRYAYRIDLDLCGAFMNISELLENFSGRTIEITRLLQGLPTKSYRPADTNWVAFQQLLK